MGKYKSLTLAQQQCVELLLSFGAKTALSTASRISNQKVSQLARQCCSTRPLQRQVLILPQVVSARDHAPFLASSVDRTIPLLGLDLITLTSLVGVKMRTRNIQGGNRDSTEATRSKSRHRLAATAVRIRLIGRSDKFQSNMSMSPPRRNPQSITAKDSL